jgi:1-acyl-sn-glycerol-3-phosphate acyltransferase
MSGNENERFIKEFVRKDTKVYRFFRAIAFPIAYLLYRPVYKGKEKIPEEGGAIIASNHIHLCDPAFILMSTKRVVRYLAKKELHDSVLGFIYDAANTIPVDRQHGAHASIEAAEAALRQGELVGIFPEGTRNRKRPGELLDFRIGAVKMAQDTGVPIIPIAYSSGGRPFLDPYNIVVGEAFYVEQDADLEEENKKLQNRIQELLEESETLR